MTSRKKSTRKSRKNLKCNTPVKSYRPGKKRMVRACSKGREKLIHFGATGYKHNYSAAARRNFRSRHRCSTAKDKLTARYWACKNLWTRGGDKLTRADKSKRQLPKKRSKSRRKSSRKSRRKSKRKSRRKSKRKSRRKTYKKKSRTPRRKKSKSRRKSRSKKHHTKKKRKTYFKNYDLYSDANPKDTIRIKYDTPENTRKTIKKLESLRKSKKYTHARIVQVANVMNQRLRVIYDRTGKGKTRYNMSKKYFAKLKKLSKSQKKSKRKSKSKSKRKSKRKSKSKSKRKSRKRSKSRRKSRK